MAGQFTPYATGRALFGQKPSHVTDPLDQERLQSYDLYERMYWNAPDTYKVTMRGTNSNPLYIPSARTIIDTSNRYTAPDFAVQLRPKLGGPDTNDVIAARLALSDFMTRERFRAKFLGAKRYAQIQGDWVWHLTADETKPVGTRLSLVSIDPSMYFPVHDPNNIDKIIGVILAQVVTRTSDPEIHRISYRKLPASGDNLGGVQVEEGYYAIDAWESLDDQPTEPIKPLTTLPPEITSIPVYHTKNFEEPGNPFGSSEIRGLETIMSAVNQTMSDEELALALAGIGTYITDAPHPVDPKTKDPVPWRMGPGVVNHVPQGHKMDRIQGVGSVVPYGDHYQRLWQALQWSSASPDIAIGSVDVQIAESGIALALQMSPILAKSAEKDDLIQATHDQMFYDIINMWYPAFEETTFTDVFSESAMGDKLPVDRAARFTELNDMLDRKVIDTQYYREEAAKLGYVFPADMGKRVAADPTLQAPVDPTGSRIGAELGNGNTGP
jgi:hypothetical protein